VKFRVSDPRGDRVLTEGVVDKSARFVFKHGFCLQLAVAVSERTGWPIISAGLADPTEADYVNDRAAHTGVLTPDGRVLDIDGAHDRERWIARFGPDAISQVTQDVGGVEEESRLRLRAFGFPDAMEESRARTFVDAVLALAAAGLEST
jgi:hypothetical protein